MVIEEEDEIGFTGMAAEKYVTEKFTGKTDFGLWSIKMKAILLSKDYPMH